MVGTTRFELATSPTPRVRSTRLSHVPTCVARVAREGHGRVCYEFKCTRASVWIARRLGIQMSLPVANSSALMRGCDVLLGQRAAFAFAEEKAVHLLDQKLLRLARPGL